MTNAGTLERKTAPGMSEAEPSFEVHEEREQEEFTEVDQMTTALSNRTLSNRTLSTKHFHDVTGSRSVRPTGFARLVMSVSLSMLKWAASRAERGIHSSAEQSLIVTEARAREAREQNARLLQLRVR
jgi:hypothetical protein